MSKNRKHGEGSVYFETSRQKWVVAFLDTAGQRHKKRFPENQEKEARAYLVEQLNDINKGNFIVQTDMTLGEWAIEWLRVYKRNIVRPSTYDYYVYIVGCLVGIANMKLKDINAFHIQHFYEQSLGKYSANTVSKIHAALCGILQKAAEVELIKKDIMLSIDCPHFEKKEIEIFSKDEIEKILSATAKHPVFKKRYAAVLLGALVGLRKGEVLALRYSDVFLDTDQIFIRRTLTKKAGKIISGKPKTKRSIRKLSIPRDLTKELKKVIKDLPTYDAEQVIFPTDTNHFITPSNFDKSWHAILANAGVEYKKFHTLRHTYATNLLASSEPIVEVSRRLGHAKVAYTLDLYGHAIPDYDRILVENTKDLYKLPETESGS